MLMPIPMNLYQLLLKNAKDARAITNKRIRQIERELTISRV